jgi:dTDP-glucose pyrophosphorylase
MAPKLDKSKVTPSDELRTVISNLSSADNRHGFCVVVDDSNRVLGTITDGDCRRALMKGKDLSCPAKDVMNCHFIAVDESFTVDQIQILMRTNEINQVPIVNQSRELINIISTRSLKPLIESRPNTVVILAGGKGLRLRPLTEDTPKPMLPVRGKPILEILLERLVNHNFTNIVISINYLGHKIENYFGDGSRWSCNVSYIREEKELGTAGPLRVLPSRPKDPVLVVNGDLMTNIDFEACVDFHNTGNFDMTLGISSHKVQIPYGVTKLSEKGQVLEIEEKPVFNYPVNAGVYVINSDLISYVKEDINYPMSTLIQDAINNKKSVGAFLIHESWCDIGLPDTYTAAQKQDI